MQWTGISNSTWRHYKNHKEKTFHIFRNFDGLFHWVTVNEHRQAAPCDEEAATDRRSWWISEPHGHTEMAEQIFGKFYTLVHKQSVKKSHFSDVYLLRSSRRYRRSELWFTRQKFPGFRRKWSSSPTKLRRMKWKSDKAFEKIDLTVDCDPLGI